MSLSLALRLALAVGFAVPALGQADVPAMVSAKPVKVSAADAAGPVFKGVFAAKDTSSTDGPATDVVMLRSKDKRMTVGLYKAGPSESDIAAYPEDEFFYLLEGAITLTSADGSVVAAKARVLGPVTDAVNITDNQTAQSRMCPMAAGRIALEAPALGIGCRGGDARGGERGRVHPQRVEVMAMQHDRARRRQRIERRIADCDTRDLASRFDVSLRGARRHE